MNTQPLLIELFVEELPPKALQQLEHSFSNLFFNQLQQLGLTSENSKVKSFATPRRLAVKINNVLAQAPDKAVSIKLMPTKVGLNADGSPSPALIKKLTTLNIPIDQIAKLREQDDGKNSTLFYDSIANGITLNVAVQQALETSINKLPIPKIMSYQLADGWTSVNFVRPVHSLVALYGKQVLTDVSVLGLTADRVTYGHRFESEQDKIELDSANSYEQQLLEQGKVVACYQRRRNMIEQQLTEQAFKAGANLTPINDSALIDEVNSLVERPNVLICRFEEEFLQVPQECLILTMKANQKYFPLLDKQGKLTNIFLLVSNLSPNDPSAIINGNERVIKPRLADAKFFFEQDKKIPLTERLTKLDKVVYHHQLGSQGQRIERVKFIAQRLAEKLNFSSDEIQQVTQAASLAKADLVTEMVGEFPELQGTMGRYYALNDGLDIQIADAIEDHYKPRFAGDSLPRNKIGVCVAIADKLETVVGMFNLGNLPSGDKDPFALRRHALGIIRMLIEQQLNLTLDEIFKLSCACFNQQDNNQILDQLNSFFYDRLTHLLKEQGYQTNEINAVLSLKPQLLTEISIRLQAVRNFLQLQQANALAEANKRVANILKKNATEIEYITSGELNLLTAPQEKVLYKQLVQIQPISDALLAQRNYQEQLSLVAQLHDNVAEFFTNVMVMCDDLALRKQRLQLLQMLHNIMSKVADLAKLTI